MTRSSEERPPEQLTPAPDESQHSANQHEAASASMLKSWSASQNREINLAQTRNLQRQLVLLREENKRLRSELAEQRAELERLVAAYNAQQASFDEELAALKEGHQQQIEQYQAHLRDMLAENRQLQSEKQFLQGQYKDLQRNFQQAVEEEAHKMIAEAANTIIMRPDHVPSLFQDVKKTIELKVRQEEDEQAAAALYLIRDAQRRARQLEEELAHERQQIASERQQLLQMQQSIREQAELRYKTLVSHLGGRWSLAVTLSVLLLIVPLPVLQSLFYFVLHFPAMVSLYVPILICLVLITIFARLRVAMATYYSSAPRKSSTTKT
ncbi:hypothetical protein KTAU_39670 [Thermogemmatispora aurantia]|uniref:Uncharacterized protein n=1 Tax=Thermogemmatispora aurantia TaxID=2045279 RepID=A0A5J4KEH5_9CHLR|nr:hypothetical protein [Thermogemmatispora aurantia]GER85332.1 hypothetical protein KTAU_39670 [Thermogemmatispora aurantia]